MKKLLWLCAAALTVALTACRTVDSGERGFREVTDRERRRMLQTSRRLGDGILEAFQKKDFDSLLRNTPGDLGERMTEKDFKTSLGEFEKKFGELRDFRLLTSLDTPAFGNLIWLVTFVRSGTNGAEIRRQLLFRLVTMQTDGKTQVVSFGFL